MATVAGQRLLWHTTGRPAVFIHRAGEIQSAWRGAGALSSTTASAEGTLFSFASGLYMRETLTRYTDRAAVYNLQFYNPDPQTDALRLVLHDRRGAKWSGLGPRETHRVSGKIAPSAERDAVAFALDGRFLRCRSGKTKALSFAENSITIEVALPASLEFGFARSIEQTCELWKDRTGEISRAEASEEVARTRTIASTSAKYACGFLGSLSFSGARPFDYQALNREFASKVQGELSWKIADMMLCQPDITLPRECRREFPGLGAESAPSPKSQNRYTKIRAALAKYWEFCEKQWEAHGIPALAHPSLFSGNGPIFDDRDDILFSGSDLIFAPNLNRGGDVAEILLPEGEWVHIWTSRQYYGGRTTVHAPKGNPALFYRSESEFAWLFDSIRQMASRI